MISSTSVHENSMENLRSQIVGVNQSVPLLDKSLVTYVNLDNAASTPAFQRVQDKVNETMTWYSSVHRGSGMKSLVSTHLYDEAREVVLKFVGADPATQCVIFTKNTSESINRMAAIYPFQPGDMVLTTQMEHHSNDLPWRAHARVLYAGLNPDGSLDLNDLADKLKAHAGQIKLVAVTGASNVSGFINPIHEIAEMAHRYGARIFVDCAQLFPHRAVDMEPETSPRHLDFIAFSAHKVYAPFGTGALVGPTAFFDQLEPDHRGGGTIEIVTLDSVMWTEAPERHEAGSPNVIGAVALTESLRVLSEVGMDAVAAHEAELTRYALGKFSAIHGLRLYGSTDPAHVTERVGVIPLELENLSHGKVAAILSFEGGVGVRDGCFCAHPYVLRLMHITEEEFREHQERVRHHDRSDLPGLVRVSFGCYNDFSDVDRAAEMFERITCGDYRGKYVVDKAHGTYFPQGFDPRTVCEFCGL